VYTVRSTLLMAHHFTLTAHKAVCMLALACLLYTLPDPQVSSTGLYAAIEKHNGDFTE